MEAAEVAEPFLRDRHLLVSARGGSEDAGRRLMADHGPSMLRTAWHVLGRYGGNDAEDVVQEAFIAALTTEALPKGDVGAWLRSIAARKALDAVRSARRRAERPLPDRAAGEDEPPAYGSPAATVATLAVREALARLSASDRAVLVLIDLLGCSMAEAAAVLGTTNVGTRLRAVRARRKLAALLRGGSGA
jgi:RNA polymerase sigma-70 factor (ECF subfamily)